jgi:hypothetical protein
MNMMIDLDDRSQCVVPVLGLATANRQSMIEAQPHLFLPKCKHWIEIIGSKTDIDLRFRQLHFAFSKYSIAAATADVIAARAPAGHSHRSFCA